MAYNNGQTVTFNGPDGDEIRVRLEVNSKARRLILRLDERRREAVAIAPSRRQIKDAAAFAADRPAGHDRRQANPAPDRA